MERLAAGKSIVLVFESNGSPSASQAVSGANLTIRVTLTASADPQVDTIYIYAQDVTAGESVRRANGSNPNSNATRANAADVSKF